MNHTTIRVVALLAAILVGTMIFPPARAAEPQSPQVLRLWDGDAPGAEDAPERDGAAAEDGQGRGARRRSAQADANTAGSAADDAETDDDGQDGDDGPGGTRRRRR